MEISEPNRQTLYDLMHANANEMVGTVEPGSHAMFNGTYFSDEEFFEPHHSYLVTAVESSGVELETVYFGKTIRVFIHPDGLSAFEPVMDENNK